MDAAAQPMAERLFANMACHYASAETGGARDGAAAVRFDAIDAGCNPRVSNCAWAMAGLVRAVFCIAAGVAWMDGGCIPRAYLYFGTDNGAACTRRADMAAGGAEHDIAALLAPSEPCDDTRPLRAVRVPPFLGQDSA